MGYFTQEKNIKFQICNSGRFENLAVSNLDIYVIWHFLESKTIQIRSWLILTICARYILDFNLQCFQCKSFMFAISSYDCKYFQCKANISKIVECRYKYIQWKFHNCNIGISFALFPINEILGRNLTRIRLILRKIHK